MNQPINDGGPAFPMGYHPEGNNADHFGMTLRDYFAAAALQGNIAHPEVTGNRDDIARDAYKYADAMLKARNHQRQLYINNEHLKLREEYISEIERENERLKEQNKRQNEAIDSLREMYAKEAKP